VCEGGECVRERDVSRCRFHPHQRVALKFVPNQRIPYCNLNSLQFCVNHCKIISNYIQHWWLIGLLSVRSLTSINIFVKTRLDRSINFFVLYRWTSLYARDRDSKNRLKYNEFAYEKTKDYRKLEDRFQKKSHFSIAYTQNCR